MCCSKQKGENVEQVNSIRTQQEKKEERECEAQVNLIKTIRTVRKGGKAEKNQRVNTGNTRNQEQGRCAKRDQKTATMNQDSSGIYLQEDSKYETGGVFKNNLEKIYSRSIRDTFSPKLRKDSNKQRRGRHRGRPLDVQNVNSSTYCSSVYCFTPSVHTAIYF